MSSANDLRAMPRAGRAKAQGGANGTGTNTEVKAFVGLTVEASTARWMNLLFKGGSADEWQAFVINAHSINQADVFCYQHTNLV